MNTIGETINKCNPEVGERLENLFKIFGTLENILLNKEAATLYHQLMLYVIVQREKEIGNVKREFLSWELTKNFDEIVKEYGGTIVLPLV